jgi:hypothetical protein
VRHIITQFLSASQQKIEITPSNLFGTKNSGYEAGDFGKLRIMVACIIHQILIGLSDECGRDV